MSTCRPLALEIMIDLTKNLLYLWSLMLTAAISAIASCMHTKALTSTMEGRDMNSSLFLCNLHTNNSLMEVKDRMSITV